MHALQLELLSNMFFMGFTLTVHVPFRSIFWGLASPQPFSCVVQHSVCFLRAVPCLLVFLDILVVGISSLHVRV